MQRKSNDTVALKGAAIAAVRRDDILIQGTTGQYFRVMTVRRAGNEETATLMSLQTQRSIQRPKAYLQGMLAKNDGTWERMQ